MPHWPAILSAFSDGDWVPCWAACGLPELARSYGPAHGQSCNESARLQERRGHEAGASARRHRLNWPEGAANRRSAKAVAKLTGLSPLLSSLGEESLQVPHWV